MQASWCAEVDPEGDRPIHGQASETVGSRFKTSGSIKNQEA